MRETHQMRVTIALPAYDEVASLERVVAEAQAVIAALSLGGDAEILVVDDGSTDGTGVLADRLASDEVRVIHHDRNRGFCGAMTTSFREARGDWVFLAAADGQTPIAELARFLAVAAEADIVVGVRETRTETIFRKTLSRGFHLLARMIFALPEREFSSAFLFRRALLDAMPFRSRPRSASLLPEILFRARRRGARLATLEVRQLPRLAGEAKGGQLSVAVLTLVELLRLGILVRLEEARGVRRSV